MKPLFLVVGWQLRCTLCMSCTGADGAHRAGLQVKAWALLRMAPCVATFPGAWRASRGRSELSGEIWSVLV